MTDSSNDGSGNGSDDGSDYKVGYRKPPPEHQFKPGNRANPRGRPKDAPNLSTILKREARRKVPLSEGGRKMVVSKLEAAVKQLMTQAARGDARAIQLVIELLDRLDRRDSAQAPAVDTASRAEVDAEILKALKARLTGDKSNETDDANDA